MPEVLARFPGARTAKVKVAERGQTLADDVARVNAVRDAGAAGPGRRQRRVDGRRGGRRPARRSPPTAPLEYVEQPCATVAELAEVRALVDVPVAADESIRKAEDPLHVVKSGAADVAVVKVAPLGGVAPLLHIASQIDVPIVVSSALDSAVGMAPGPAGGGVSARIAVRLRARHRRPVRRGRRRPGAGRGRSAAGRDRGARPGAAVRSGRAAGPAPMVGRADQGLLPAAVLGELIQIAMMGCDLMKP